MKLSCQPSGTRWAALLYGAGLREPNLLREEWNDGPVR